MTLKRTILHHLTERKKRKKLVNFKDSSQLDVKVLRDCNFHTDPIWRFMKLKHEMLSECNSETL